MKPLRLLRALAIVGALALAAAPVAGAHGTHHGKKNIVQTAAGAGDFNTLVSLVKQAGLAGTLSHDGPFTVFAPTDEAFAKVPKATLDALGADPALLKKVLLYHVVSGRVTAAQAAKLASATTVEGENVSFTATAGGGLEVNDSNVVAADIKARNGIIHAVDSVLMPPSLTPAPAKNIVDTAVAAGDFTTLVKLLQATGLDAVLAGPGPFTVFAPTDEAFAKLPKATLDALAADPALLKKVLTYHVLAGAVSSAAASKLSSATTVEGENVWLKDRHGVLYVNHSAVTTPDVTASNGVIHVIDKVLIPPSIAHPAPTLNIVDTAVAAGDFTTLVKLLHATGLDTVLAGAGPFTVFAPTDEAFAKLPKATLDALAADPALLKKVLLYHVVSGEVLAKDAAKAGSATTVEGDSVVFTKNWRRHHRHGWLRVNDATVVKANVLTTNGVIHVIDKVLIPPAQ